VSDTDRPRVTAATAADIDAVTDQWVRLARGQRRHGSTLLAAGNRAAVREWVAQRVVTGELLVARDAGSDGGDGTGERAAAGDSDAGDSDAGGNDPSNGDPLLGFVGFSLEHDGYERECTRGTVTNLFVRSDRRGEGIGSALLSAAERALAEAGADAVALEALADNDRARAFYDNRGYDAHRIEFRKEIGDEE
jgi:ribosomal protein S18 acetylase RimI-like enzyme